MPNICLIEMTDKQRDAWKMRYQYGWRMRQIAIALGINKPSVSKLLHRAHVKARLPRPVNFTVARTKPRRTIARSLSGVTNY